MLTDTSVLDDSERSLDLDSRALLDIDEDIEESAEADRVLEVLADVVSAAESDNRTDRVELRANVTEPFVVKESKAVATVDSELQTVAD